MKKDYRHTQYGKLMFAVFIWVGILIAVVAWAITAEGRWLATLLMIAIYLLGVALFFSFTVEISAGKLKFWFGIGWIRNSIDLAQIQSVKEVVSPWYYVWGIKSLPGGWWYAIAPGEAVEIVLKDGKIFRIGSDQSKILKETIDSAITQLS